jgi:hypothetical protein
MYSFSLLHQTGLQINDDDARLNGKLLAPKFFTGKYIFRKQYFKAENNAIVLQRELHVIKVFWGNVKRF